MNARVARTFPGSRACIMKAGPVLVCWHDTLALSLFAILLLAFSVRRFQKNIE